MVSIEVDYPWSLTLSDYFSSINVGLHFIHTKKQTPEYSSSFWIQKWEPAFQAEQERLIPSHPIVMLIWTLPFLVDSWPLSAVNMH